MSVRRRSAKCAKKFKVYVMLTRSFVMGCMRPARTSFLQKKSGIDIESTCRRVR